MGALEEHSQLEEELRRRIDMEYSRREAVAAVEAEEKDKFGKSKRLSRQEIDSSFGRVSNVAG